MSPELRDAYGLPEATSKQLGGIKVILHVHDEIVASGHKQQLPEFMRAVTTVPVWAPGFPLGAEGGIIPRYAKSPPRGLLWKEQAWLNGVKV